MNTYEIYETFTRLGNIASSALELIEKLINLECSNKKKTVLYQKYLEYLKLTLEAEDDEYQKLDHNPVKSCEILQMVNSKVSGYEFIPENSQLIYKRIGKRLGEIVYGNPKNIYFFLKQDRIPIPDDALKQKAIRKYEDCYLVDQIVESEIIELFIKKFYKNQKKYNLSKYDIVKVKYYYAFFNAWLEHKFVQNSYNEKDMSSNFDRSANLAIIDKREYNETKIFICENDILRYIGQSMDDELVMYNPYQQALLDSYVSALLTTLRSMKKTNGLYLKILAQAKARGINKQYVDQYFNVSAKSLNLTK